MNYTRTAVGLLSVQYCSVLKKCFLINMGLFALGAVAATPAQASIDDYKGVEYTGKGTDTAATTLYFKWVQDTNLGIYKLEQTADADSHINLYNDIKNAYVTADSTNISTADG